MVKWIISKRFERLGPGSTPGGGSKICTFSLTQKAPPTQGKYEGWNPYVYTNLCTQQKSINNILKLFGVKMSLLNQIMFAVAGFAKAITGPAFAGIFTRRNVTTALNWRDCVWHEPAGLWIAVANTTATYMTSPDGITWTNRTLPTSGEWHTITSNGTVVTVLAAGGSTSNSAASYYSYDGINWTGATTQVGSWLNGAVVYNGALTCAVSGGNGTDVRVMTSTNGINWTARTMPVGGGQWSAISWTGTHFVACNINKSYIARSSDGITWTYVTIPATGSGQYVSISDGAGRVLVWGGTATYNYSTDHGATWTSANFPVTPAAPPRSAVYSKGTFIISIPTTRSFYTSTDMINWTLNTVQTSGSWFGASTNNDLAVFLAYQAAFVQTIA